MLYHGAQRVKLTNLSKISRLLSPLAIFLRFQAFQRYMIGDVVFWWKVDTNFGHFAATLYCRPIVIVCVLHNGKLHEKTQSCRIWQHFNHKNTMLKINFADKKGGSPPP